MSTENLGITGSTNNPEELQPPVPSPDQDWHTHVSTDDWTVWALTADDDNHIVPLGAYISIGERPDGRWSVKTGILNRPYARVLRTGVTEAEANRLASWYMEQLDDLLTALCHALPNQYGAYTLDRSEKSSGFPGFVYEATDDWCGLSKVDEGEYQSEINGVAQVTESEPTQLFRRLFDTMDIKNVWDGEKNKGLSRYDYKDIIPLNGDNIPYQYTIRSDSWSYLRLDEHNASIIDIEIHGGHSIFRLTTSLHTNEWDAWVTAPTDEKFAPEDARESGEYAVRPLFMSETSTKTAAEKFESKLELIQQHGLFGL